MGLFTRVQSQISAIKISQMRVDLTAGICLLNHFAKNGFTDCDYRVVFRAVGLTFILNSFGIISLTHN